MSHCFTLYYMTDFQALINNAIKELRNKTGLSQEKFSEKCGLSTVGYRNIEYNRYTPKASTINKICKAFNLTPIDLLQMAYKENNRIDIVTKRLIGLDDRQIDLVMDFIALLKRT